jgi:ankyrin repeat protein
MSPSLPEHPDLRQLRRQAKELRDSARADDPAALGRIAQSVAPHRAVAITLATAQLTIAREHGFPSWPRLKAAVDAQSGSPYLEAFLTASVNGWAAQAARLLAGGPGLARASMAAAATLGEARVVSEFIAADAALAVAPDLDRGWPPLLYACYSRWHRIDPARASGLLTVAGLLLDAGASPDTDNDRPAHRGRRSALHGSVTANHPDTTRLLLDRGARPDEFDCLYQAATHPDNACLELLLRYGAPVANTWAMDSAVSARNPAGLRLLLAAAARNEPGEVAAMATSALTPAAETGQEGTVEALLAAGADPNAPDDGLPLLRRAVRGGHQTAAAALVRHGAIDIVTDADRLIGACVRADQAEIEQLVAGHPGLAERVAAEEPGVLAEVAGRAPASAVRLLVTLGFPPDTRNGHRWGETALHAAAGAGQADTVRYLLSLGADVNARDERFGATPLAFATVGSGEHAGQDGDWPATVRLLLDAGSSHEDAWLAGKPPSNEVAEVLRACGVPPESG